MDILILNKFCVCFFCTFSCSQKRGGVLRGTVIAAFVVIVIVVFAIVFMLRKKKKERSQGKKQKV